MGGTEMAVKELKEWLDKLKPEAEVLVQPNLASDCFWDVAAAESVRRDGDSLSHPRSTKKNAVRDAVPHSLRGADRTPPWSTTSAAAAPSSTTWSQSFAQSRPPVLREACGREHRLGLGQHFPPALGAVAVR